MTSTLKQLDVSSRPRAARWLYDVFTSLGRDENILSMHLAVKIVDRALKDKVVIACQLETFLAAAISLAIKSKSILCFDTALLIDFVNDVGMPRKSIRAILIENEIKLYSHLDFSIQISTCMELFNKCVCNPKIYYLLNQKKWKRLYDNINSKEFISSAQYFEESPETLLMTELAKVCTNESLQKIEENLSKTPAYSHVDNQLFYGNLDQL